MASAKDSKETTLPIYIADAFTKRAFGGNPAAVCPLNFFQRVPEDAMQKIAAEMNLSETAFVSLLDERETFQSGKRFGLRWFTPTREVPLCGHATLATAAVLFFAYSNQSPVVEFETLSGTLKAKKLSDGRIEMDFPVFDPETVDIQKYEKVIEVAVGSLPFKDVLLFHPGSLMIRLRDDVTVEQFKQFKPRDGDLLAAAPGLFGLIVTLKGSGKDDSLDNEGKAYDFLTRYFGPWTGVAEDPVTGSAHSTITPYWAKALNKKDMYARQCSKRGGDLYCSLLENRVGLSGYSVIILEGKINFKYKDSCEA